MNDTLQTGSPIDFDPRHVETFLSRIREDRDRELAAVRQRVEAETAQIRTDGHRAARRLAHEMLTGVRERERREHDRFLYKVRAELIRERWSILDDLRRQAGDAVRARFEEAWRDGDRQWKWCCYWVDAASALAHGAALDVRLGGGAGNAVAKRIEQRLESYPGEWSVGVAAAPAGILVSWPDHRLDGTLAPQVHDVTGQVMERLVALLDPAGEVDGHNEPG